MSRKKRNIGLSIMSVLYAGLWLVTFLGAMAPWVKIEALPILQLLPTTLTFLLPFHLLFFLYFLRRSWKGTLGSFVAICLCIWAASKDVRFGDRPDPSSTEIRVISFNVGTFNYKAEKINEVAELLKRENPDVITLQEFRNHHLEERVFALEYLADALEMPYFQFVHLPVHIHGAAIYSRYPIVDLDTLFMPPKEINNGILATLETPMGLIGIGNMHLSSFQVAQTIDKPTTWLGKSLAMYRRSVEVVQLQAEKVDLVMDKTQSYKNPMILTGDLNASPHTRIVQPFFKGFQDSFDAAGKGMGWTFPVIGPLGLRIDYQFASPELTVVSHDVLRSRVSDHYPILATYRLEP
ncbi:MAG: endonuclease/exonuclease/phosphatase family protein [Bacteroidota bacterium]